MAGLIPQSFIDDLLNRADIVDVVSERITLKKAGRNYSACCPFHQEKTPSFTVSPDKQFYYCFGCGASGNAIGFVMDYDHRDFPEAVEILAHRLGLVVPHESSGQKEDNAAQRKSVTEPLYDLVECAAKSYKTALKENPDRSRAIDYLKERGVSGTTARDYALGYAPAGWDHLTLSLGKTPQNERLLIAAGLAIENPEKGRIYDRFRDRIMFPIRDRKGRTIAFGGRVLGDDKPKYLNSPETAIFQKHQTLYGLYEARQFDAHPDHILIVEGYMDVVVLAQAGIRHAVATLGTATSDDHIKRLFQWVNTLVFCFDGDNAGRRAAWRALEVALPHLKDGHQARFVFLPEGEDPDSLVRKEGREAFMLRTKRQSNNLADYFFEHLSAQVDFASLEGKAHLASLAVPYLLKLPKDGLLVGLMFTRLSEITAVPVDQLTQLAQKNHQNRSGFNEAAARHSLEAVRYGLPDKESHHLPTQSAYTQAIPRQPSAPSKSLNAKSSETSASLHIELIKLVLRHPQKTMTILQETWKGWPQDDIHAQTLGALLGALEKQPQLSGLELLALWHGTPQAPILQRLFPQERSTDAKGVQTLEAGYEQTLEKNLKDSIDRMAQSLNKARYETLTQQNWQDLTDEEKALMRHLHEQLAKTAKPQN